MMDDGDTDDGGDMMDDGGDMMDDAADGPMMDAPTG